MTVSSNDLHGADLVALELREEAGRLLHHPIAEVKRLEHVAVEGESPATLILLITAVILTAVVIAGAAIAVTLTVYYTG